jgi:outer membrane protein OmpA-like peptidoglycan-associated protein
MQAILSLVLVALALVGCTSTGPQAPVPVTVSPVPDTAAASAASAASVPAAPASAPTAAAQRTAIVSTLAVERQWLASWFKGTPVVVAQGNDGAVTVEVPRQFCFERGKDALKPALVAVLDKVAETMRRVPQTDLQLVAAPGDVAGAAAGGAPLALKRAARVQEHLRTRNVPAARLGKPAVASGASVLLRIEASPPA